MIPAGSRRGDREWEVAEDMRVAKQTVATLHELPPNENTALDKEGHVVISSYCSDFITFGPGWMLDVWRAKAITRAASPCGPGKPAPAPRTGQAGAQGPDRSPYLETRRPGSRRPRALRPVWGQSHDRPAGAGGVGLRRMGGARTWARHFCGARQAYRTSHRTPVGFLRGHGRFGLPAGQPGAPAASAGRR